MIGGALGALIYDRVFSTRACRNTLYGCKSKDPQKTEMTKEVYVNETFTVDHSNLWPEQSNFFLGEVYM